MSSLTKHLAHLTTSAETMESIDNSTLTTHPQPAAETKGKCHDCVQKGNINCSHCFICGQSGHRAIGCLQRKLLGNGKRSLERGSL